ncbi:MAG TPA: FABP family protein [Nakamurella sp.]
MSDQPGTEGATYPTADEIAGLVSAERTAGEYVPFPHLERADPTPGEQPPGRPDSGIIEHGSGSAAVAAALARAKITRALDIPDVPPLPIPPDTANVRSAPGLHPQCASLLPLVGVWRGTGQHGNDPGAKDPHFGQQITISHDGRPFLRYESVCWLLGPDGAVTGPGAREVGFWRPQPDGSVELLLAHAEGRIELFYGQPRSAASRALSTDAALRTPTAPPVVGATRLYGITPDGRLAYVEERAQTDIELAPHASAALERVAG